MNASNTIKIERIEDFEAIDVNQWNELVTKSATRSVFQRYEWNRTWWNIFGSEKLELLLLVSRDQGTLVGIASMYVDEDRVVRFIGHGRSDYSDLICPAERNDIRSALLQRVAAECEGWQRMEFRHLPSESPTVQTLHSSGLWVLQTGSMPCPTLLISQDAEFFEQARKKKSLRRHQNFFCKQAGYRVDHFRRASEIQPLLDAFFVQHKDRWKFSGFHSLFDDPLNRRFYQSIVDAFDHTGVLRFTRISIGDSPIAFHFGFVFCKKFYWYKPTFDPALAKKSPGEVLLKELLDLAQAEQLDEFDFTVGGEEFKQRFANHSRDNIEATCYASPLAYGWHAALHQSRRCLKFNRMGRQVLKLTKRFVNR